VNAAASSEADTLPPESNLWPRTHRVAVGAFIFQGGQMLLLKRANSPFTFAPAGGKLEIDEDPVDGLRREVREEAGIEIRILGPAKHWYGSMDGIKPALLCLNFIAETDEAEVRISEEHSDYRWISRDDLMTGRVATLDREGYGYRLADILAAFDRYTELNQPFHHA
jgi:8-oxo-dGTP diphosphatase